MPTKSKVFIDSNFFIYLLNKDEAVKRQKCADLLLTLEKTSTIVISTQVVKEVSAVLLRKYHYPVDDLKVLLSQMEQFEVVETPVSVIRNGVDIMQSYRLSFWDALICAASANAKCTTIITEDMNNGQQILGMKIQSPFA
jgi:predicted nucleic acid-binding protein